MTRPVQFHCPACGEDGPIQAIGDAVMAHPTEASIRCAHCETDFRVELHPIWLEDAETK